MIRVEMHGQVALLTLDRPPANALNHEMMTEIVALLPRLRPPETRAVVVTGAGRFFSAGLDLFEVITYEPPRDAAFAETFDDAITGLFALQVPMVAAVNGHAVAGGAVVAATADLRLMAEGEARTGLTEIQVGVPFPTSALEAVRFSCAGPHLPELLYRGLTYPAGEAVQRRLADELVPPAELLGRALALAEEMSRHPHAAFAASKRALRAESLGRMAAARDKGQDPVWQVWHQPETRAAMAAYRDRAVSKGQKAR